MRNRAILLSLILLIALFFLSLFIGSVDIKIRNIFDFTSTDSIIFFSLRIPRTLGALLAGIAFASSGYLIQSATSNDLASPNIIGINSGAGCAVLFFLSFFPSLFSLLPVAAFFGALIALSLVFLISSFTTSVSSSSSLILSGIAVNALFNALISVISALDPDVMSSYSAFSIGGFSSLYASSLYVPGAIILMTVIISYFALPFLSVIKLGDEIASSMGYKPRLIRLTLILLSALSSASAVTFSGLLGFVGLVTPHIASFLTGGDVKRTFKLTLTIGPSLVLLSDILARTIVRPSELPAGAFMALIGVPFFVFLLISKRRLS